MATPMPAPSPGAHAAAVLTGRHGTVSVFRTGDTFLVVAGDPADPDRHEVLTVSRPTLAVFAADVLAHLPGRPTERVSVPYDEAFPVSVQLAADHGVLNVLDDGDDLSVLTPGTKRGASRLTPADVEVFARTLVEVTR